MADNNQHPMNEKSPQASGCVPRLVRACLALAAVGLICLAVWVLPAWEMALALSLVSSAMLVWVAKHRRDWQLMAPIWGAIAANAVSVTFSVLSVVRPYRPAADDSKSIQQTQPTQSRQREQSTPPAECSGAVNGRAQVVQRAAQPAVSGRSLPPLRAVAPAADSTAQSTQGQNAETPAAHKTLASEHTQNETSPLPSSGSVQKPSVFPQHLKPYSFSLKLLSKPPTGPNDQAQATAGENRNQHPK